jgi:catechol 2,3-dioxygenase-like lactoylglutathione lyase family enzyme
VPQVHVKQAIRLLLSGTKSVSDWYSLLRMNFRIANLDHIQIAAPEGCEVAAREFYGAILGMPEIRKPEALRSRGGCWFQCGPQQLHVGVDPDFRPARKAHPAFVITDLDELRHALLARGIKVTDDTSIPGSRRFFAEDPWGNRLEFLETHPPNAPY